MAAFGTKFQRGVVPVRLEKDKDRIEVTFMERESKREYKVQFV